MFEPSGQHNAAGIGTQPATAADPPTIEIEMADLYNCWPGGAEPTEAERGEWLQLEISGVRDDSSPEENGTYCVRCDDSHAQWWSVYACYASGEAMCITDGPPADKTRAIEIAKHLARRWRIPLAQ